MREPRRVCLALRFESLERRDLLAVNPLGGEFQVNTTTEFTQSSPAIAIDADGNFVVVWHSSDGSFEGERIFAQRYGPSGESLDGEFRVNTSLAEKQVQPTIAMDSEGDFVVAWVGRDGSHYGIYAQRFSASGQFEGPAFRVNTVTTGAQLNPAAAMAPDGRFVIAWDSETQGVEGLEIRAQRFDASGNAQESEIHVNSMSSGRQQSPAIAFDAAGVFVIAWESHPPGGELLPEIHARQFTDSGVPFALEFAVDSTPGYPKVFSPSVAMRADGNFVVVWSSEFEDGSNFDVFGRRFDATGAVQGSRFQANSTTESHQYLGRVAMNADGGFVVVWQSTDQDGHEWGVVGREFDSASSPRGPEFIVNSTTTMSQSDTDIAMESDGDFVVVWRSDEQDGSYDGIFGQRYAGRVEIELNSVASDSAANLLLNYEIAGMPLDSLDFSVYVSSDLVFDGETPLGTITIEDPGELTPGLHSIAVPIGGGPGQIPLPGAGVADTDNDYYLLAVVDPFDAIPELDETPVNEDNLAVFTGAYRVPGGPLMVHGRDVADAINVKLAKSQLRLTMNGAVTNYPIGDVPDVRLRGHGGNDKLTVAAGVTKPSLLVGGRGNDTLTGGGGHDLLLGGLGNDKLNGKGGNDTLDGEGGTDTWTIEGSNLADLIDLAWDDLATQLVAERRNAAAVLQETDLASRVEILILNALNGDDDVDLSLLTISALSAAGLTKLTANGGSGHDTIRGSAGNDTLNGGSGIFSDTIYGGDGNDKLDGGQGDDFLFGESGNDKLYGRAGNDFLHGGAGIDFIDGGTDVDDAEEGETVLNCEL